MMILKDLTINFCIQNEVCKIKKLNVFTTFIVQTATSVYTTNSFLPRTVRAKMNRCRPIILVRSIFVDKSEGLLFHPNREYTAGEGELRQIFQVVEIVAN